jgi:hypothetical protein
LPIAFTNPDCLRASVGDGGGFGKKGHLQGVLFSQVELTKKMRMKNKELPVINQNF